MGDPVVVSVSITKFCFFWVRFVSVHRDGFPVYHLQYHLMLWVFLSCSFSVCFHGYHMVTNRQNTHTPQETEDARGIRLLLYIMGSRVGQRAVVAQPAESTRCNSTISLRGTINDLSTILRLSQNLAINRAMKLRPVVLKEFCTQNV